MLFFEDNRQNNKDCDKQNKGKEEDPKSLFKVQRSVNKLQIMTSFCKEDAGHAVG